MNEPGEDADKSTTRVHTMPEAQEETQSLERNERGAGLRRRPGRFRRWILRPAMWLLVIILALSAILLWLLHLPRFQRSLVDRYLPSAESALGRVITVGEVRARLLPLTIEIRDLTLAGPRVGDPTVVSIERVYADIDLPSLWERNLQLDRVEVEGLTLFVEQLGSETNLPSVRRGQGREAGSRDFRVALGTLEVVESSVRYENLEVPLVVSASGIEAALLGQQGVAAEGHLAISEAEVQVAEGKVIVGFDGRVQVDAAGLRVDSARLQSDESRLSVEGAVLWGSEPEVELEIAGVASTRLAQDLGYLGSDVQATANLEGNFTWRPEAWGFRAGVESDTVRLMNQHLITNVEARVAGDPNGVWVDVLAARYSRGDVEGRYEIDLKGQTPVSSIDLHLEEASTPVLLTSLGLGVEGLGGVLSGDLSYRFLEGDWQSGTGWGTLQLDKTSIAAAGPSGPRRSDRSTAMALSGSVPFTIEGGVVSAQAGRFTAPEQRVLVSAVYDLARSRGEIRSTLDSLDLAPIVRLLPGGLDEPPPLWLPQSGIGTAGLLVQLEPDSVALDVDLDLSAVEAPGLDADRLVGHLELRDEALENLRFEFTRAEGAGLLTGRVPLNALDGLDLGLHFVGWPLTDAEPWLPFDLPLSGLYHGGIQLEGAGEALVGSVEGRLEESAMDSFRLGSLATRLSWDSERLTVAEANLAAGDGAIRGSGTLEFETGGLALELKAEQVALERLPATAAIDGLRGRLDSRVRIAGSLDQPDVELEADLSELSVHEVVPGGGVAQIVLRWRDGLVELHGEAPDWLVVDGGGRLDSSGSALQVQLRSDDLSQVAALLAPGENAFSGNLETIVELSGDGPLAVDRAIVVVPSANLGIGENRLSLLEEARLVWVPNEIQVESLYLGELGTQGDAFVRGRIGLDEPRPLDLRIQAQLAADWLEVFLPGSDLTGAIDVLGSVRGTLEEPRFRAQAGIEGGKYRQDGVSQSLDEIDGVVLFDPDAIIVDRISARLGAGAMVAAGRLDWPVPEAPLSGRVQLAIDNATVRYLEGAEVRGTGELVWSGTATGQSIRGVVNLDRARYLEDLDIDLLSLVEGFLRRRPETVAAANTELDEIAINVAVRAPGSVRVKNNVADLRGSADLSLRGTLARPVVFGTVESESGSELEYGGNSYELSRAVVTFANPYRMEPLFDIEATTKVAAYDVSISLFGSLERLKVSFGSDPPLPDAEVLSLLLVGRSADSTGFSKSEGGATAESLLYGQATNLIGKRVGTLFGFDSLRVEPLSTSGKSLSSARVSVGKRLSSRWYATYSYDPSSTANQRIQLEWQATDSLLIRMTQDDDSYGVDFLWENSF